MLWGKVPGIISLDGEAAWPLTWPWPAHSLPGSVGPWHLPLHSTPCCPIHFASTHPSSGGGLIRLLRKNQGMGLVRQSGSDKESCKNVSYKKGSQRQPQYLIEQGCNWDTYTWKNSSHLKILFIKIIYYYAKYMLNDKNRTPDCISNIITSTLCMGKMTR